ncbi:hypothetical protein M422DRAFT_254598 [Sphaerobolus stellatus SS14]|uniref:Uncharacterized protein n=1 Tax=Sphaerobolus stellatus (strain SS14) TaxID=990650 RepID=A0A0C9VKJ1_SPHS4|nr:hypothetical protein M422DRAFT_254598 [Sphaerobolus stellatus SS14]
MAAPTLPSHMLVWKKSSEVICMKDVLAGDLRRTVLGFQADKKFTQTVPKLTFDEPNEEEEDRVPKVKRYWEEKEKGKGKEKEVRPSRNAKGKGKGGPKTLRRQQQKMEPDTGSDSNGEEEYCKGNP